MLNNLEWGISHLSTDTSALSRLKSEEEELPTVHFVSSYSIPAPTDAAMANAALEGVATGYEA
jgi:hypothetical protein